MFDQADYYKKLAAEYKKIHELTEGYPDCQFCGTTILTDEQAEEIYKKAGRYPREYCNGFEYMQPDPFAEEIHDDHTEYLLCDGQAYQNSMDI